MSSLYSAEKASSALPRRRWFQFSLRMLLLVMLILGCGLGWIGNRRIAARKAWEPIRTIQAAYPDAYVLYGQSLISRSMWIEEQLGIDFPNEVTHASWSQAADGPFLHHSVNGMQKLEYFWLTPASGVTDDDLLPLSKLPQLRSLWLRNSTITGEGFRHFVEQDSLLYELDLSDSAGLTLEGLSAIAELKNLKELKLNGCGINDEMLSILRKSKTIKTLEFPRINASKSSNLQHSKPTASKTVSHYKSDVMIQGIRKLAEIRIHSGGVDLFQGEGTLHDIRRDIRIDQFVPLSDR